MSRDNEISTIAREILGLETLERRNSDSLDYHDLSVWVIREALEAAHQAGSRDACRDNTSATPGDPFRQATADAARHAIDRLQVILNEATGYLIAGNHLAAWGTLVLFDDAAEDLKAAIRLHRAANARGRS
jgi:hypothetical protein